MMFLLVSSWVHKCLWGLIGLLSDYHNSPGFLCKCKDTFTALLSHIAFSLAPVDRHQWAHFFWLVTRTNAHVCSSGWCMCRDGVISNVFSLFVYVLIRKRLVISIFITTKMTPTRCIHHAPHTHTTLWTCTTPPHVRRPRWNPDMRRNEPLWASVPATSQKKRTHRWRSTGARWKTIQKSCRTFWHLTQKTQTPWNK